jgi:hypothetical protein
MISIRNSALVRDQGVGCPHHEVPLFCVTGQRGGLENSGVLQREVSAVYL